MAMMHILIKQKHLLFVQLTKQQLDLGLTDETINKVWSDPVMSYP